MRYFRPAARNYRYRRNCRSPWPRHLSAMTEDLGGGEGIRRSGGRPQSGGNAPRLAQREAWPGRPWCPLLAMPVHAPGRHAGGVPRGPLLLALQPRLTYLLQYALQALSPYIEERCRVIKVQLAPVLPRGPMAISAASRVKQCAASLPGLARISATIRAASRIIHRMPHAMIGMGLASSSRPS